MDFFSKCEQFRSFLRICSHLLRKFLMETLNGNQCMSKWITDICDVKYFRTLVHAQAASFSKKAIGFASISNNTFYFKK